ncbi:MAG: Trm112 family protein [Acidimicrobiaceae bacterium]|nr:Trm112 family protein [Acidimicrobiaceae bacterium]
MALDTFLLELIEDPADHGVLRYVASRDVLYNPRTRQAYDVRDDIPVLLTSEVRAVDAAEHEEIMNDPSGRDTGRP